MEYTHVCIHHTDVSLCIMTTTQSSSSEELSRGVATGPVPALSSSRRVTIKTIAQEAGVHHTTVSLALRRSPRVRPELAKRIRKLARDAGYYPLAAAQLLRNEHTNQLSIVVAQSSAAKAFSGGSIASMLGQVVDACMAGRIRYTFEFCPAGPSETDLVPPHSVAAGLSDGTLLIGKVGDQLGDWFDKSALHPWVSLLEPATYWVQNAADQATRDSVEMLYGLGHRRIAHAAGPQIYTEHCLRHEAFLVAANRLQLSLAEGWATTFGLDQTLRGRLAWARALLDAPVRPTVVICPGAPEARVLIAEAMSRGLCVPRDLSVVAWTTVAEAEAQAPILTRMCPDGQRIAMVGLEMLMKLIRDEDVSPRFQSIPALTFPGETCGPVHRST